ncbi:MAG: hypothetical protein ACRC46_03355 [Thermoguttaceae bacterium]
MRHYVQAPGWQAFDGKTQFMSIRAFPQENGKLVRINETLDEYEKYNLGKVTWPDCSTMFTKNLDELAATLKQRGYFMVDVWGYVPGVGYSGGGGYCEQFEVDPAQLKILTDGLGDRWLGMDNGEQDGRYIGGYAPLMYPISGDHFEQYKSFQRHFERLCNDQGNVMATLVSLNFGHHFLKEGNYTLIGAEAAQALPNSQVYYAYNRGAGKQYGVLWFGNASVFNRWGWKSYPHENPAQLQGPKYGTSLALLKRLLYSHILYNSAVVGFESNWIVDGQLTPIGKIQSEAANWLDKHGHPGVMATPVAMLTDFYSGWSFPQHLYTGLTYRVWGNIPYGPGDYLNNNVLGMIYPKYQDSSYFHDETGFLTPTPYGDIVDCLMTDAESWLLERYPMMIVSGALRGGQEIKDKLTRYVEGGGRLVMTAGNIAAIPDGFLGVTVAGAPQLFKSETAINVGKQSLVEERSFELLPLSLPENAEVIGSTADGFPAIVRVSHGKGWLVLFASPFGIGTDAEIAGGIHNRNDESLPNPFPLLNHVMRSLHLLLNKTTLMTVGDGLGSVICRKGDGLYTVGVFNNELREKPFEIQSRIGAIESIRELPIDTSERGVVGFLPLGFEDTDVGQNTEKTIAGGDVRIFEVRLKDDAVVELPHPVIPKRTTGRYLPLRTNVPIKEEILARSTFFEHFDGVHIDWRYLANRSSEAVAEEAGWIKRNKLNVVVDFSSGINLFPDLRLIRNDMKEYEKSLKTFDDIFTKMEILGATKAIVTTHRAPEISYPPTEQEMIETLRLLCAKAQPHGISLVLRVSPHTRVTWLGAGMEMLKSVGADNMQIAPHMTLLESESSAELLAQAREKMAFVLVASPQFDVSGAVWSFHGPLVKRKSDAITNPKTLQAYQDIPLILDAVYEDQEQEYLDIRFIEKLFAR